MFKTTGFISFALRRFTGLILAFYLVTHILVLGAATQGTEAFNARMEMIQNPVTLAMEALLLAAVIYHAFDGTRLLIVHWFGVTDKRKSMWYAAFAISALLTVAGGLPMVIFALEEAGILAGG